ncbi:MAG: butyrate kinase [Firmicutes bacterium HGW-Firmicutes-12]|jgi:butyrate kinase|nr:MAG: butyrate kinase [Firmicutes bacterium HGW-Firmicutes-12]
MTSEKILKILAINPGSTTTKIALFENEKEKYKENLEHSRELLNSYKTISQQYLMRKEAVLSFLEMIDFKLEELSAVVGRGGTLPPVKAGAYYVNDEMIDRLTNRPLGEHASNLGAMIAYEIGKMTGVPAFIYDSVAVDELDDVARISGLPDIERKSLSHALNMRASAIKTAQKINRPYTELNLVVAHMGGGITMSVHKKGKMIDIISDDEGPFAPERAGRVPCLSLVDMCYSARYDHKEMKKKLRGKGGLLAYFNTTNALDVEEMIKNGEKHAELIYYAMAYQIAKGIGELATVVDGEIDRIILTGGLAHSKMITGWISQKVRFIAPVEIIPGENELESLAMGVFRVMKGEEKAHEYDLD